MIGMVIGSMETVRWKMSGLPKHTLRTVDMNVIRSKKGMTLLETILALAVLGIVAAPLLMVFTNAAAIAKKTQDRLEINAVTRIIKANVTNSVKYGVGHTIFSEETGSDITLKDAVDGKDLQIKDAMDKVHSKYKFDAERTADYGTIAYSSTATATLADTCEYLITLKTADGEVVQKLKILINKVDDP